MYLEFGKNVYLRYRTTVPRPMPIARLVPGERWRDVSPYGPPTTPCAPEHEWCDTDGPRVYHQSHSAFPIHDAHRAITQQQTVPRPLRSAWDRERAIRLRCDGSCRRVHDCITHTSTTCQGAPPSRRCQAHFMSDASLRYTGIGRCCVTTPCHHVCTAWP